MKGSLLRFVVTLCAVSLVRADQGVRSLQQTLRDQGFYYGAVTGTRTPRRLQQFGAIRFAMACRSPARLMRRHCVRSIRVRIPLRRNRNRLLNLPRFNLTAFVLMKRKPGSKLAPAVIQPAKSTAGNKSDILCKLLSVRAASAKPPIIAGAQYQLISRGYYSGRADGHYGSRTALAVRAFQSSAGLPPTGRLDMETVKALGLSDTNVAYSAPVSGVNETWMPVTKFKHGRWIVKWKKSHRPVAGEDGDEDRQANSDAAWNPYNHD